MKYRGKYSLVENMLRSGRGLGVLTEDMELDLDAAQVDVVHIDDTTDEDFMAMFEVEPEELMERRSRRLRNKKNRINEAPVNKPNIKARAASGKVTVVHGCTAGQTYPYSLYTLTVVSVQDVILKDGNTYTGVPETVEFTRPNGTTLTYSTNNKTLALNRAAAAARKYIGDDYELGVANKLGGSAIGGAGRPDVIDIPLQGGGKATAEVGGKGKVSQMGNAPNGLTAAISGGNNSTLHHARRIALKYPNAMAAGTLGQDPGGDPCVDGQSFGAPECYDFWTCSQQQAVEAAEKEDLIIMCDKNGMNIYALRAGITLSYGGGTAVTQLGSGDCKAGTLKPAGDAGPDRFGPAFPSINWNNATKIPW